MSRSVWKGPFVDPSLIKKVEQQKTKGTSAPIKTWSRKSTIIPEFIGTSFVIHNGKKFIPIRQFVGHTPADKKAAQTAEAEAGAPAKAAPGAAPGSAKPSDATKPKEGSK